MAAKEEDPGGGHAAGPDTEHENPTPLPPAGSAKFRVDVDATGTMTITPTSVEYADKAEFLVTAAAPYTGVCARWNVQKVQNGVVTDSGVCSCHVLAELPAGTLHLVANKYKVRRRESKEQPREYTVVRLPAAPPSPGTTPPGHITPFSGTGDVHDGSGDP